MNMMKKKKGTDLAAIGSGGLQDTGLLSGNVPKSGNAGQNSNGIGVSGGKNVMTQNANGVGSGGQNVMTQGASNTYRQRKPVAYDAESGGYALRQSLINAGISDDDIRWDGTYVIVGGQKYLPYKNLNGVTFAPKSDINNFINAIYKERGTPLTQANAYVNEYGLGGLLSWNDDTKQVMIDGKPVDYAYVDDNGNAWVQKSVLDAAYKEAAERRGMFEDKDIDDEYRKKTDELDEAAQKLIDREKNWDYTAEDIKNDPEYQARAKQYRAEAMRSYLDMMNDMASRNGGNLSSAAIQAAGSTYNRNMEGLHGIAAEVRNNAYDRFMSGLNAERDELAVARNNALTEYQMKHQANERELEQNATLQSDEMNRKLNKQTLERNALTLEQARLENDYKNAQARGFWLPDEAARWGVDVNASPYDPEVAQMRQNWYGVEKDIYSDRLDMQTDKEKEITSFNDGLSDANLAQEHAYDIENAKLSSRLSIENAIARIKAELDAEKERIGEQSKADIAEINAQAVVDERFAALKDSLDTPSFNEYMLALASADETFMPSGENRTTEGVVDEYIDYVKLSEYTSEMYDGWAKEGFKPSGKSKSIEEINAEYEDWKLDKVRKYVSEMYDGWAKEGFKPSGKSKSIEEIDAEYKQWKNGKTENMTEDNAVKNERKEIIEKALQFILRSGNTIK